MKEKYEHGGIGKSPITNFSRRFGWYKCKFNTITRYLSLQDISLRLGRIFLS